MAEHLSRTPPALRGLWSLFNFVYDPATLLMAYVRVAGNLGARTPGVDGLTVADIEEHVGVPGFLDDLRAAVKDGSFRVLAPLAPRLGVSTLCSCPCRRWWTVLPATAGA